MSQLTRWLLIMAAAVSLPCAEHALAADDAWPFFAFDNGVGRDQGWKPDRQAELTARLGYDGIGYTRVENLDARFAASDTHGQRVFSFYESFDVGADPPVAPRVLENLPKLQGKDAIIWCTTHGEASEDEAVAAFRKFADEAAKYGARVAIYPHDRNYVETGKHALKLAKAVDRQNFGMSINLCHELKAGMGDELLDLVKASVDHLFLVSINGADRVPQPQRERGWARLIQPLGEGDFDLIPFLAQLRNSGYQGPIGLQCYQVKGEIPEILGESIRNWRKLVAQVAADETRRDPFHGDQIVALMRKVNDYQRRHPWRADDRDWIRATYYTGVTAAYHATGDARYLEQAKAWGEKHQWQVGGERHGYNKLFCSNTWLALYLIDRDPKKIEPTIQWLKADKPNSPGGGAAHWYGISPTDENSQVYSDSLYGSAVFSMLYQATGDGKYLDIMHDAFSKVTDAIFDNEAGLYYRDQAWIDQQSPNGKRILWSRGNGWVFAAIPRILNHLPEDDPDRDRYVALYKQMAAAIIACQHEDGLWRANLADPRHYLMPETSGTAFFAYGLAWGIHQGILDTKQSLPALMKAWDGLVRSVHTDGKLGWVQPVDHMPRPSLPETTHEYAVGAFLLAGSEILKLAKDGIVTSESAEQHLYPIGAVLPPAANEDRDLDEADHPLADEIDRFLDRQTQAKNFSPTGLDRHDYLEIIAAQVKVMKEYQNAEGRIIDPVEKLEKHYSTACYAHCVATLVHARYAIDDGTIESGLKAMDVAIETMVENSAEQRTADFFVWPVMLAYELFEPFVDVERKQQWRALLDGSEIRTHYKAYHRPFDAYDRDALYEKYGDPWGANWNLLGAAGEYLRAREGLTDLQYTDFSLTMQLPHFTSFGMYEETGDPLAYDLFARHYATGMLQLGYRSFVYTTYRDLVWRGAWTSLFLQSPTGELPTGYRSSQHIWNEAEQAVVFEVYASQYAAAGRLDEAGAFKRAARLALSSIKNWIRSDGTGYIVKNRYAIEAQHGYEWYSAHTVYNLLACSIMAQAWQFADDAIDERPCPADIGGFVVVPPRFHKIIANAGGTYIEYETSGDLKYTSTGLIRIHLRDGHPQLGPSDGTGIGGAGCFLRSNSLAEENLAVGPGWKEKDGTWVRLAGTKGIEPTVEILEESAECAKFKVTYRIAADAEFHTVLTQTITVKPNDVLVEDRIEGRDISQLRVYFPMLVFDGKNRTDVMVEENRVRLKLDGKSASFEAIRPSDSALVRTREQLNHRNGLVEPIYFDADGGCASYRVFTDR